MAIKDYVEAQGAVLRVKDLRRGLQAISVLIPAHLKEGMVREAERLEAEVAAWCNAQECPKEAEAIAHRRFWELDTQGRLLPQATAA